MQPQETPKPKKLPWWGVVAVALVALFALRQTSSEVRRSEMFAIRAATNAIGKVIGIEFHLGSDGKYHPTMDTHCCCEESSSSSGPSSASNASSSAPSSSQSSSGSSSSSAFPGAGWYCILSYDSNSGPLTCNGAGCFYIGTQEAWDVYQFGVLQQVITPEGDPGPFYKYETPGVRHATEAECTAEGCSCPE